MPVNYEKVYLASGATDAVMVKLFLESLGIPALMFEESAGIVYGLTVGPLAETEIWVPVEMAEEAKEYLRKMDAGELTNPLDEKVEIPPEMQDLAEENRQILSDDEEDSNNEDGD